MNRGRTARVDQSEEPRDEGRRREKFRLRGWKREGREGFGQGGGVREPDDELGPHMSPQSCKAGPDPPLGEPTLAAFPFTPARLTDQTPLPHPGWS